MQPEQGGAPARARPRGGAVFFTTAWLVVACAPATTPAPGAAESHRASSPATGSAARTAVAPDAASSSVASLAADAGPDDASASVAVGSAAAGAPDASANDAYAGATLPGAASVSLGLDLRALPRGTDAQGIDMFVLAQGDRLRELAAPTPVEVLHMSGIGSLTLVFRARSSAAALATCKRTVAAYMKDAPRLPVVHTPGAKVVTPCASGVTTD